MHKKKRDDEISEEVLCAEYEAVYHYARSICGDENEAADLTQETFCKAMRAKGQYKGSSSLYTWLCAIAKNTWINKYKKQARELPFEMAEADAAHQEKSVEQEVILREAAFQIHEILHEMKEPYKEVFTLRVFGQLSFAEIARLFDRTESWARVTYYRAKKQILEKTQKGEGI